MHHSWFFHEHPHSSGMSNCHVWLPEGSVYNAMGVGTEAAPVQSKGNLLVSTMPNSSKEFVWNYIQMKLSHFTCWVDAYGNILQGWRPMHQSCFVVKTISTRFWCIPIFFLTGSHRQQLCIQGCTGSWGAGSDPSCSWQRGPHRIPFLGGYTRVKTSIFWSWIVLKLPKNLRRVCGGNVRSLAVKSEAFWQNPTFP